MNDFELNRAIAEALGYIVTVENHTFNSDGFVINGFISTHAKPTPYTMPDYVNNWNDLMPLVVEHGISSLHQNFDNSWIVDQFHGQPCFDGENLQRALAECLLKVLLDKQESDSDRN